LEVCFERGIPSIYNNDELTKLVADVAFQLLGAENVVLLSRPSMGSEDFAIYLEHTRGTMFRLGAAGEDGPLPGLHTPTFDVDERCLVIGAKILARSVLQWAKSKGTMP
jgi:amidohydrolase